MLAAAMAPAATFTVTNTNNSGPGSLYQAITDSNVDWDQDTIVFNIPGPGVHVIDVGSQILPDILRPVLIDGYTQPGAHPNTLAIGNDAVILIQVKGPGTPGKGYGFWIKGGLTRIRGLSLTDFSGSAILMDGPGGGNAIEGNFIGVDPSGQTAAPNSQGIRVSSPNTTLGGSDPSQRNVISGNRDLGARITVPAVVAGNYIGTNATGTAAIPNRLGIEVIGGTVDAHGIIGGADANSANVVSGNTSNGIQVGEAFIGGGCPFCFDNSTPADYTVVSHNLVGTTADGLHALGNGTGIWISDSNHAVIGANDPAAGNVIAFNTYAGVAVQHFLASHPCLGNSILSNRIYGNGTRGIVLMGRLDPPLANDPGDADTGANNLQNYPFLTSSTIENGIVTSNGTLNSVPNTQFLIQFFADSRSITTPSQVYLGSTTVATNGNGNATFAVNFPIGDVNVYINATATNLATGDTSEFYYTPPRLVNVSTRLRVQTGDNVLIGGFIVGPEGANVVVRGIGPSLGAYGITGVLEDPIIYLSDSTGRSRGINDNWRTDSTSGSLGSLAPTNDLESALYRTLDPGAYTVVLANKDGGTGVGLVEVYLQPGNGTALANISTRGFVETGDNVMIGGFIATDSNGPARYVIRAIGPSLANAGISNPLADPVVELHDGNGALIAVNDNWQDGDADLVRDTGLAPQDAAESVILEVLQPGAYTAIVRGKGGSAGVALVEVYNLR